MIHLSALTLLVACAPSPPTTADLEVVLRELATANAQQIYAGIWDGVEQSEGVDLGALESGTSLEGALQLPTGSGDVNGVDAALSLDWGLDYVLDAQGWSHWTWALDVSELRLQLSASEVQGWGAWTVEHTRYELNGMAHAWQGQISVDGGETLDVSYESYFSGNLHWVRGSIGDTDLSWENPDADLP